MKKKFINKAEQQLKENIQKQEEYVASLPTTGEYTGKGWLELSKDLPLQTNSLTLKELRKKLKELMESKPITYNTYWKNILDNMSPASQKIFNDFLKKEAEKFMKEFSHDKPII